MKKIIAILTAMIMTMIALSCGVSVSAGDTAETVPENELIAGNISEKCFDQFSFRIEGSSIIINTKPDNYGNWYSFYSLDVATNDKIQLDFDYYKEEYTLTPDSSGKYVVQITESYSDYFGTFDSLEYYYLMVIECHDNVVDIDIDNIYSIRDVNFKKPDSSRTGTNSDLEYLRGRDGTYIIPLSGKETYLMKDLDSEEALWYLTSCYFEGEDHFFVWEYYYAMFALMSDDINSIFNIKEYNAFGFRNTFDLIDSDVESINGKKPASKLVIIVPELVFDEDYNIFKADKDGVTKYNLDIYEKGNDSIYFIPETFTSEKLPENDINCDGEFNVSDAVMMCRYLQGLGGMNVFNARMADICRDEVLDVFDYCMLKNRLLSPDTA